MKVNRFNAKSRCLSGKRLSELRKHYNRLKLLNILQYAKQELTYKVYTSGEEECFQVTPGDNSLGCKIKVLVKNVGAHGYAVICNTNNGGWFTCEDNLLLNRIRITIGDKIITFDKGCANVNCISDMINEKLSCNGIDAHCELRFSSNKCGMQLVIVDHINGAHEFFVEADDGINVQMIQGIDAKCEINDVEYTAKNNEFSNFSNNGTVINVLKPHTNPHIVEVIDDKYSNIDELTNCVKEINNAIMCEGVVLRRTKWKGECIKIDNGMLSIDKLDFNRCTELCELLTLICHDIMKQLRLLMGAHQQDNRYYKLKKR